MKIHSVLGPGLLESAYQACLAHELRKRGLEVAGQVEVKSVEAIHPIHEAQLLSYMRLSRIPVGLLINFNGLHLRDGIERMVEGKDWEK